MKKSKDNAFDIFVYFIICICSFGLVYLTRVVITTAIKKALED
jgi:hypothetical protein